MNISMLEYFEYFDNVYISDGVKTALSTHGLGKIYLIAFVRRGQWCNQSSSNIHDGAFDKNRNDSRKKINLRWLAGSRTCLCRLIHYSS